MMQFSLISLIPGLLRNLQDCADPELDAYERSLAKPTSLKTSDRGSLLNYMGLPLQIFGKVGTVCALTVEVSLRIIREVCLDHIHRYSNSTSLLIMAPSPTLWDRRTPYCYSRGIGTVIFLLISTRIQLI